MPRIPIKVKSSRLSDLGKKAAKTAKNTIDEAATKAASKTDELLPKVKAKAGELYDKTKVAASKLKRKTKKTVNNVKSELKEAQEQAKQKAKDRASVVDVTEAINKAEKRKRIKSRNRDIAVAGTAGAAAGLSLGSMKKEEYDELKVIRDKLANDKPLTRREKDILFALQLGEN